MTLNPSTNSWIISQTPNSQASLRLFCFPHAGGSAQFYYKWKDDLPKEVALYSIQMPGRGVRLRETPNTRISVLVQELAEAILPYLDKPFAFFAYSVGALIAFELTRELRRRSGSLPKRLFVSARRAPQAPDPMPPIHKLPDGEFLKEIKRFNGIPRQILEDADLMQVFLPALRADLELNETYHYSTEAPLPFPITAYGGLEDKEVSREQLEAWREQTCASFSVKIFPGDHFFIQTNRSLFLRALIEELNDLV